MTWCFKSTWTPTFPVMHSRNAPAWLSTIPAGATPGTKLEEGEFLRKRTRARSRRKFAAGQDASNPVAQIIGGTLAQCGCYSGATARRAGTMRREAGGDSAGISAGRRSAGFAVGDGEGIGGGSIEMYAQGGRGWKRCEVEVRVPAAAAWNRSSHSKNQMPEPLLLGATTCGHT
uniref:Uncharacterized protein n=1 Tax=Physcomitrium patens TaxID=3218 RepID=A0A2K1KCX4_PHYPA|nr:hypothetical protein PHYPA_010821 [Physcomitrium patens]